MAEIKLTTAEARRQITLLVKHLENMREVVKTLNTQNKAQTQSQAKLIDTIKSLGLTFKDFEKKLIDLIKQFTQIGSKLERIVDKLNSLKFTQARATEEVEKATRAKRKAKKATEEYGLSVVEIIKRHEQEMFSIRNLLEYYAALIIVQRELAAFNKQYGGGNQPRIGGPGGSNVGQPIDSTGRPVNGTAGYIPGKTVKSPFVDEQIAIFSNKKATDELNTSALRLTNTMEKKNNKIKEQKNRHEEEHGQVRRNIDSGNTLANVYRRLFQILVNIAGYGGFFTFLNQLRESVRSAYEWEKAISEIRTISDRAAVSTDQWRNSLRGLSDSFGVEFAQVAEAAYQALSDQIVEGAEAIDYIRNQINLSLVAVSSLESAVQATDSVINAFGESIYDASRINAILFTTVEEGRLRLEEIGNTLGRVNILSSQLGVTFAEQEAALSLLTRQGVPASEAMTLLRNLMLKMIRPTEHMTSLMEGWGYTSGEAAMSSLGLVGVLQKLASHAILTGDATKEIGEIFGRQRAIVAAAGLALSDYEGELDKFGSSSEKYLKALEERLNSTDVKINILRESFHNFFTVAFGEPILKAMADYSSGTEHLTQNFLHLFRALRQIVTVFIAYRAASLLTNAQTTAFAQNILTTITGLTSARAGVQALTTSLYSLRVAQAGATLGITLLIAYLIEMGLQSSQAAANMEAAIIDIERAFSNLAKLNVAAAQQQIDVQVQAIENALLNLARTYGTVVANLQKDTNVLNTKLAQEWKDFGKVFDKTLKEVARAGNEHLGELEKALNKAEQNIEGLKDALQDEDLVLRVDFEINKDLDKAVEERVESLQKLLTTINDLANKSIEKGNLAEFETLVKQADRVRGLIENLLKEMIQGAKTEDVVQATDRMGRPIFDKETGLPVPKKVKGKDEGLIDSIEAKLVQLERDKRDVLAEQLKLKEKYIEAQETEAANLKNQIEEQKVMVEDFQAILAELDTFDSSKGTSADFNKLVVKATEAAAKLQIPAADQTALLRDARAKANLLDRDAARKDREDKLLELKRLKEMADTYRQTVGKQFGEKESEYNTRLRQDLPTELAKDLTKFLEGLKNEITTLDWAAIDRQSDGGLSVANRIMGGHSPQKDLKDMQTAVEDLIKQLAEAVKSGDGEKITKAVERIDAAFNQQRGPLFDAYNAWRQNVNVGSKGTDPKMVFRKETATEPALTARDVEKEILESIKEFDKLQKLLQDGAMTQQEVNEIFEESARALERLEDSLKDPGIQPLLKDGVNSPDELRTLYQNMENLIKEINTLNKTSSVNVGDIYIQVPEGTPPAQAERVAQIIRREIRLGLLS